MRPGKRVLVAARLSQVRKPGKNGMGAQTGIDSQSQLTTERMVQSRVIQLSLSSPTGSPARCRRGSART